jgi:hypothetical protein
MDDDLPAPEPKRKRKRKPPLERTLGETKIDSPVKGTFYLMFVANGRVNYVNGQKGKYTDLEPGWYWREELKDEWDGPWETEREAVCAYIEAGMI